MDEWENNPIDAKNGEQITNGDVVNEFTEKYYKTVREFNERYDKSFVFLNEKLSTHSKKIKDIIKTNCI
jgi:hypothetical protein